MTTTPEKESALDKAPIMVRTLPMMVAAMRFFCFVGVALFIEALWLSSPPGIPCGRLAHGVETAILFQAPPPFCFRVLGPLIGNLPHLLGEPGVESLSRALVGTVVWPKILSQLRCTRVPLEITILIAAWLIAFTVYLYAVSRICVDIFRSRRGLADAAALLSLFAINKLFENGAPHYWYDPFALALFPCAVWALAMQRWLLLALVCTFGMLNKETFLLFLIPLLWRFFAHRWWRSTNDCARTIALAIWLIALRLIIAKSAGSSNPAFMQINFLFNVQALFKSRILFDFPLQCCLAAIAGTLVARFRSAPAEIQGCLVLFPVFLFLYLVGGYWGEVRVFLELAGVTTAVLVSAISEEENERSTGSLSSNVAALCSFSVLAWASFSATLATVLLW